MDFNEAAVFVKVVQAGGFSAAARLLGLPVSTVSTRVARLEKRLGMTQCTAALPLASLLH